MKIAMIAAASVAALVTLTASAEARSRHHQQSSHYAGRHHYRASYANLDAACSSAARQGGPCGCWAQEYFFHSSARIYGGHNLWLAREWARAFPHVVVPVAGNAAVWPGGHHVAPVIANNGDGTVTVHDSWGDHAVRTAGLTFVSPTGGNSYAETTYASNRAFGDTAGFRDYSERRDAVDRRQRARVASAGRVWY